VYPAAWPACRLLSAAAPQPLSTHCRLLAAAPVVCFCFVSDVHARDTAVCRRWWFVPPLAPQARWHSGTAGLVCVRGGGGGGGRGLPGFLICHGGPCGLPGVCAVRRCGLEPQAAMAMVGVPCATMTITLLLWGCHGGHRSVASAVVVPACAGRCACGCALCVNRQGCECVVQRDTWCCCAQSRSVTPLIAVVSRAGVGVGACRTAARVFIIGTCFLSGCVATTPFVCLWCVGVVHACCSCSSVLRARCGACVRWPSYVVHGSCCFGGACRAPGIERCQASSVSVQWLCVCTPRRCRSTCWCRLPPCALRPSSRQAPLASAARSTHAPAAPGPGAAASMDCSLCCSVCCMHQVGVGVCCC
jgi:hypothetical protein